MTLVDVARLAGTSTAVVSYVMNDGPRPVAPDTRTRVLRAVTELGYRPNTVARALRSRSSGVVGLVVPEASNPYFSALAHHIEQVLQAEGRLMLIGNATYSAARQRDLVERFVDAQVDGLIIVAAGGDSDVAASSIAAGVPCVYVHHRPTAASAPVIGTDNCASVQLAVTHLRFHGHERIAFLAGPDDTGPVGRRLRAWRDSATGGDLLRCDYTRSSAAQLLLGLKARGDVPEALVTGTDEQALGVLAAAHTVGVHVPEHLAVISLDGTPESAFTAPALTVTEQPLAAMARTAVEWLTAPGHPPSPVPDAPLVIRRSCGCTPSPV